MKITFDEEAHTFSTDYDDTDQASPRLHPWVELGAKKNCTVESFFIYLQR